MAIAISVPMSGLFRGGISGCLWCRSAWWVVSVAKLARLTIALNPRIRLAMTRMVHIQRCICRCGILIIG